MPDEFSERLLKAVVTNCEIAEAGYRIAGRVEPFLSGLLGVREFIPDQLRF